MHVLTPRVTWPTVLSIGVFLACAVAVDGAEMRFMPIRRAPLGSPTGTVGDPVTSQFNAARDCWEVITQPGVEIDLEMQAFGWGSSLGNPALGAIQGTLEESGLDNGTGTNLNPKGWPESPMDGAYQPNTVCGAGGDGSPCVLPFDVTCANNTNGFCIDNPDWVMPPCANDLAAMAVPTLGYAWATAALNACAEDDGQVKVLGGLILEVPVLARGSYRISLDSDPNNSFMTSVVGTPIPGVAFTSACITVVCQSDTDCDDGVACTTDSCNQVTGSCESTIASDQCVIDGICYGNGVQDPTGPCRICNTAITQTAWSFRPAGLPCGPPFSTSCDGADTCDDAGECQDNIAPDGTACEADGNECTDDVCSSGACAHPFSAPGTSCGDQTESPCDGADSCDANGTCLENILPDASPCLNGVFCDGAEACMSGVCLPGTAPCDPEAERCDEANDQCNTLGDFDGDRVVTLSDYAHWQDCETGPIGGPYAAGCEIFDFEPNDLVDLRDFERFQRTFDAP